MTRAQGIHRISALIKEFRKESDVRCLSLLKAMEVRADAAIRARQAAIAKREADEHHRHEVAAHEWVKAQEDRRQQLMAQSLVGPWVAQK
jgi:hypothetical protein